MRIISKYFKLPSGITVRQYLDTTERQVYNLAYLGIKSTSATTKPQLTIK